MKAVRGQGRGESGAGGGCVVMRVWDCRVWDCAVNKGIGGSLRGPYFKKVFSEGRAVCLSAQRELGASWRERFFEIRYP